MTYIVLLPIRSQLAVHVGFEDILSAQDTAGVAIATTPVSHARLAFAALDMGKASFASGFLRGRGISSVFLVTPPYT